MIILDTNVLSECLRPAPEPQVLDWLARQPANLLFLTAITEAEILYGIAILDSGRRRDELAGAAAAMFAEDFGGRILGFDTGAALAYAAIASERRRSGHPISQFDCQIAAIVKAHGAALATRNTRDFEACGIELIDPWQDG
mgnify:FL=1